MGRIIATPQLGNVAYTVPESRESESGDVIATVGEESRQQLRAPLTCHFVPGLDGFEGRLSYQSLRWEDRIPQTPELPFQWDIQQRGVALLESLSPCLRS